MTWTTTELLAGLRRRGRLPDGQPTDADLLLDADSAIRSTCLTLLRTLKEGYGLVTEDTAIVANRATYSVPSRALGQTVEAVYYVDDNGDEFSLTKVAREHLARSRRAGSPDRCAPYVYALRGGDVVLAPTPTSATGSLRFEYQERPGRLVPADEGAQVSAVVTSDQISVSGPAGWGSSISVDIRAADSPFSPRLTNQAVAYVSPDMTAAVGTFSDVAVGDWVTLTGETVVVPVPDIMHSLLVAATLMHVHQGLGHVEEMARMEQVVAREMAACRELLEPRSEDDNIVLNPDSALRGGWSRW